MALETLRGVKEIGGFDVDHVSGVLRKAPPIEIDHDNNAVTFKIQNGPVKENGVNGCQVDTIIRVAKIMYEGFQAMGTPHPLTAKMIDHCQAILDLTDQRTKDRESRNVEGTSEL